MPVVWIPALLRPLTGGQARVQAAGATVQAVIVSLEAQYPGLQARLITDGQLRPELAVVVDGQTSPLKLRQPLTDASEVHFVIAMSGGAGP
ncbi:MAG: MoaD/ThiS family protein [Anaerolineales bacterium]|nr:MoaD/ThiS family protein [Anaerolineales bacterium]